MFNAWSLVGRTVREGLGGVALLEKVCHWRTLEVSKAPTTPRAALRHELSAVVPVPGLPAVRLRIMEMGPKESLPL